MPGERSAPGWALRLADLRRARAWSPADLACELKKQRPDLPPVKSLKHMIQADWESGKHRPGPRYRLLLAAVYDADENDIFGDEIDEVLGAAPGTMDYGAGPGEELSDFGGMLRHLMAANGLGVRATARLVICNAGYISNMANGIKKPSRAMAAHLDEKLGANGELVARLPEGAMRRSIPGPRRSENLPPFVEEQEEEMERRRLLQSLAALGVSISPFSQALEAVRMVFGDAVGYDERRQLDSWEESVVEYGYSYRALPSSDLIPNLAADLLSVRSVIRRVPKESADYRGWCRVGGAMSGLMAKSLSNLGRSRDSREWWNMAVHLTDVSGDLDLGLWVRSQRIIHGLYENRAFPVLLREIDSATNFSRDHPCAGLADLSAVRAQASILTGDYRSAEADLNRTEDILGRLPSAVTDDNSSALGWGEAEFRYTQAWVYSHLGDEEKTDRSVRRCLSLYAESDSRGPVQVNLLQALARVQGGDISEGIRHAHAIYEPLASHQITSKMVSALALRVLNSVPADEHKRSEVAAYRLLVMSSSSQKAIEA